MSKKPAGSGASVIAFGDAVEFVEFQEADHTTD